MTPQILKGQAGRDFATLVQATNPDGTPSQIQVGDTTTAFSTIQLNREDTGFVAATKSALSAGVVAVRDEAGLGAVIDKPPVGWSPCTPTAAAWACSGRWETVVPRSARGSYSPSAGEAVGDVVTLAEVAAAPSPQ